MTVSTFCARRTTEQCRYIEARGPLVDPSGPVKMGGGFMPLFSPKPRSFQVRGRSTKRGLSGNPLPGEKSENKLRNARGRTAEENLNIEV